MSEDSTNVRACLSDQKVEVALNLYKLENM